MQAVEEEKAVEANEADVPVMRCVPCGHSVKTRWCANGYSKWRNPTDCKEHVYTVYKPHPVHFVGSTEAITEANVAFTDETKAYDGICFLPEDVFLSQPEASDLDLGIWDSGCRKTVGGEEFLQILLQKLAAKGINCDFEKRVQRFRFGHQGVSTS